MSDDKPHGGQYKQAIYGSNTKLAQYPEAAKHAEELRGQGYGYRKIADALEDTFGLDISYVAVGNYLNDMGKVTAKMIESDQELKGRLQDTVLKVAERMEDIDEVLHEIVELWRNQPEEEKIKSSHKVVSTVNSMMKQLKLQRELLEDFTNVKTINVQQNQVQLGIKITQQLERLEDAGYIKILKNLPGNVDE